MKKVDFTAKYDTGRGKDTLFPFGFHCTGSPIYAMAYRLRNGDEKVRKHLIDSGVTKDDIEKFHDPIAWLQYYPMKAFNLLKRMNLSIDFSRSFITTSRNPYYDSFVKWQFNKLNSLGLIFKGKRDSIYSTEMKLICGDHERSVGEGVEPAEFKLSVTMAAVGSFFDVDVPDYRFDDDETVEVTIDDDVHIMNKILYQNIVHQGLKKSVSDGQKIMLPESKVVSRIGDTCIVAKTEQWYINYADVEWKDRTKKYIETELETYDDVVKRELLTSLDWIHERGFSREVGLGTKIPWDDKYVIESLSDSTIYMAYYTVSHLLHHDLYGDEPNLVKPEELNDEFWEEVFMSGSGTSENPVTRQLQAEFRKWYPVTMRVSGKDLIPNHLLMCLMTHLAIFGEDLTPKSYLCNGYITINGQKMSKSAGNFITVEDLIDKYPEDAINLTLASAGDSTNDANFDMRTLKTMEKKLEKFRMPETDPDFSTLSRRDQIILKQTVQDLQTAYATRKFQDVVKLAFHARNAGAPQAFYRLFLAPIIPNTIDIATTEDRAWLEGFISKGITTEDKRYLENLVYLDEFIKKVNKTINKSKKKGKKHIVAISSTVDMDHEDILTDEYLEYIKMKTRFNEITLKASVDPAFRLTIESTE